MKKLVIGGRWDVTGGKESGVVKKLAEALGAEEVVNGGFYRGLPRELEEDLVVWMPEILGEGVAKHYPIKKQGSVLICSKVMREGYRITEAVSRIFRMHGNAVIAVYPGSPHKFQLLDALANEWYFGESIQGLAEQILKLYNWTKQAVRINTRTDSSLVPGSREGLSEFIELNNQLAGFVHKQCGERFFGNLSTRCQKFFPTTVAGEGIWVSPRNSNKEGLTPADMVWMTPEMKYLGNFKPSVDAPTQIKIYQGCPQVKYMIHGHAFIEGAPTTKEYYLCGDVREADEVSGLIGTRPRGFLNLKNHGFLIWADTLEGLARTIDLIKTFSYERTGLGEN